MTSEIIDKLKDSVGSDWASKLGFSSEKQGNDAVALAEESVKEEASGGLMDTIGGFFGSDEKREAEPESKKDSSLETNFIGKMTSKLGIDEGQATSIAKKMLPMIMSAAGSWFSGKGSDGEDKSKGGDDMISSAVGGISKMFK